MRAIISIVLSTFICVQATCYAQKKVSFEKEFVSRGFVNIKDLDSTIKVKLMYSTADNFTEKDMYGDLEQAYFLPEIARMIASAQKKLKAKNPELSLLILDASRPMSVQQEMHDLVDGTPQHIYVANPKNGGGRHNYGTAVDITIIDKSGKALDMGSGFDHFGETSHCGNESELVKRGLMSVQAQKNRALLKSVMTSVGFTQHPKEWWHFHKYSMAYLKSNYRVLDF